MVYSPRTISANVPAVRSVCRRMKKKMVAVFAENAFVVFIEENYVSFSQALGLFSVLHVFQSI